MYNLLCVVFLKQSPSKQRTSLLAMAVGLKQKRYVDEIVKKVYSLSLSLVLLAHGVSMLSLFFYIQSVRDLCVVTWTHCSFLEKNLL